MGSLSHCRVPIGSSGRMPEACCISSKAHLFTSGNGGNDQCFRTFICVFPHGIHLDPINGEHAPLLHAGGKGLHGHTKSHQSTAAKTPPPFSTLKSSCLSHLASSPSPVVLARVISTYGQNGEGGAVSIAPSQLCSPRREKPPPPQQYFSPLSTGRLAFTPCASLLTVV